MDQRRCELHYFSKSSIKTFEHLPSRKTDKTTHPSSFDDMSDFTTAISPSVDDLLSCADALFSVPGREVHLKYQGDVRVGENESARHIEPATEAGVAESIRSTSEVGDMNIDYKDVIYSVNGQISKDIISNFRSGQSNCIWGLIITPRSGDDRSKEEEAFLAAAGDQEVLFTPDVPKEWKGSEAFAALTLDDFQPSMDGYVTDDREDSAGLDEEDTTDQATADADPYEDGVTVEIAGYWKVLGGAEVCAGSASCHARLIVLPPANPESSAAGTKRAMSDKSVSNSVSGSPSTKPEVKKPRRFGDPDGSDPELPEIGQTNLFRDC